MRGEHLMLLRQGTAVCAYIAATALSAACVASPLPASPSSLSTLLDVDYSEEQSMPTSVVKVDGHVVATALLMMSGSCNYDFIADSGVRDRTLRIVITTTGSNPPGYRCPGDGERYKVVARTFGAPPDVSMASVSWHWTAAFGSNDRTLFSGPITVR